MLDFEKKFVTGIKWTTFAKIISAGVNILKITLLTKFLSPSDFGLMALVVFVIGFAELFMDMGLNTAILHKQNISQEEYSSIFWLNLVFSIIFYLIVVITAPFVASFYGENQLAILIPIVGLNFILSAIGKQFYTIAQKKLYFNLIATVEIIAVMLSLVISIVLAVKDYGVYSLVYASVSQIACFNLILFFWGIQKNKIYFHFSFEITLPFLKIGLFQMGGQIINYFSRDLDTVIVGKFLGTHQLGIYSLAKQLASRPISLVNSILTQVASPILASIQNDKQQLKLNYLKLIKIIATLNFLIYFLIFISADLLIPVLYGNSFEECIFLLRIFCLYMFMRSINNPVGSLLVATGRTDLDFKWNFGVLLVTIPFLYFGAFYDVYVIALLLNLLVLITFIPAWYFFYKKLIDLSLKEYLNTVLIKPADYYVLYKQLNNFIRSK